ncbi:MAG: alpha/beta hydrolase [Candidatus Methanoperedens sp.]|nr:alpha/beta hydrolase [Candidatus Methanoperedens sp.]
MPKVKTNDIMTYYEIHGEGHPLVFIHGSWVDHKMWNPQVEHFSKYYRVITYDVRGHGQTGGSAREKYSVDLWADDLKSLLDALSISKPTICGLSLGGMIAQAYAVKYPDGLKALVLADTAVSTSLTLSDKIQKYVVAPKFIFISIVRLLGAKRYTDFAFWLARVIRGEKWFGLSQEVREYVRKEMSNFDVEEFNKIFAAIYDFTLLDLSRINVPTLIINGEFESKAVFTHTETMKKMIENSSVVVIPDSGHTSNMENPIGFNRALKKFLEGLNYG